MKKEPNAISLLYPISAFSLFLISYAVIIPFFRTRLPLDQEIASLSLFSAIFFIYVLFTYRSLPWRNPGISFLKGALSYFLIWPFIFLWAFGVEWVLKNTFDILPRDQDAVQILKMKGGSYPLILFICLIVPIIEEILFRGYLQQGLKSVVSEKYAILITAFIFAIFHFSPAQSGSNITILTSLFWLACFMGYLVERTGSLWTSIGLHATFNTVSSIFILKGSV
ncbi:MAG: lysostaphin resistance A-like protein [Parachlamydiaceae bacterium]